MFSSDIPELCTASLTGLTSKVILAAFWGLGGCGLVVSDQILHQFINDLVAKNDVWLSTF